MGYVEHSVKEKKQDKENPQEASLDRKRRERKQKIDPAFEYHGIPGMSGKAGKEAG